MQVIRPNKRMKKEPEKMQNKKRENNNNCKILEIEWLEESANKYKLRFKLLNKIIEIPRRRGKENRNRLISWCSKYMMIMMRQKQKKSREKNKKFKICKT